MAASPCKQPVLFAHASKTRASKIFESIQVKPRNHRERDHRGSILTNQFAAIISSELISQWQCATCYFKVWLFKGVRLSFLWIQVRPAAFYAFAFNLHRYSRYSECILHALHHSRHHWPNQIHFIGVTGVVPCGHLQFVEILQ
jgi:hypothetical protein